MIRRKQMEDKRCGGCKFFGAPTGKGEMHFCENVKSIYKAARAIATGCSRFEEKGGEEDA